MKWLNLFGLVLLSPSAIACQVAQETTGLYFGQTPPGDVPAVFAPGIISLEDRFEQFLLFSPDGRTLTFGVTNADWSAFSLRQVQIEDGRWTEPVVAPFLGSDPSALTACWSFESDVAFFTSARPSYPPADIWMSRRGDTGWAEPVKVGAPISSDADEFEVAISQSGTLYFSSARDGGLGDLDLYRARRIEGAYTTAENLGPPVNTSFGDDLPYIAPDESYLILASDRPGGLGNRDLYISFQVDGAWTEPTNLGPVINSTRWEIYPSVSPDGRYLFFTRRESWQTIADSDIYWVNAGLIERLREATVPR